MRTRRNCQNGSRRIASIAFREGDPTPETLPFHPAVKL
jgi:hypothetical protein